MRACCPSSLQHVLLEKLKTNLYNSQDLHIIRNFYMEASEPKSVNPMIFNMGLTHLGSEGIGIWH